LAVNEGHEQFCASDEWRAELRSNILPAVLGDTDLGADLLEIGPGYGATTDYLREQVERLTAVEIHPELAARLAERYAGSNVEVVCGDATALEADDDRFSAVTCFFMLHHVPSAELQDRLFAEVARVLRPGGAFVAADSIASDALREFHHDDVYQPVDPAGLADRLQQAGLVDVDVNVYRDQGWNASGRKPASV
jgi:ubiquinone/menaquinone biosynthesis C-methylase UbiE